MKKKQKKKPSTYLAEKSIPCVVTIHNPVLGDYTFNANYIDKPELKLNLN
jgi:hypothetical protein